MGPSEIDRRLVSDGAALDVSRADATRIMVMIRIVRAAVDGDRQEGDNQSKVRIPLCRLPARFSEGGCADASHRRNLSNSLTPRASPQSVGLCRNFIARVAVRGEELNLNSHSEVMVWTR